MLIRHIRPRLRPAGNAVLRVRRGHPLAGGLVACIVTGGQYGLGRDLVTGADFTGTNSPTISLGPDGPAADFSSTAYAEAPHDASWNVLGHVTVLWRGVIRTPTTLGYFVGKVPAGGAGATNTPFSMEYHNGVTAGPTWIRSNATGGDPYKLWVGPANSIIADTPQTIAISTDDTITTTPSIYIDGALVTTTFIYGFGGGAPTGNTDPLRLARRQDGAEQQNGLTSLVMIAAAQWDAGQHALANLSPYGVLEEVPRYYFATPSASGVTVALTGVAGTGAVGSVGSSRAVAASGVAGTGAAGTVAPGLALALTGVEGLAAVGDVGIGGDKTVALTGVEATGAVGDVVAVLGGIHGTLRRRGRYRVYRNVPVELAPAVDLAAGYVEAEVERAVEDAMRRLRALSLKASVARRTALVQELNTQIVAAVARAAEADEEDAIAALL